MTKAILIICLFITIPFWGQDKNSTSQKDIYNLVNEYLRANNFKKADSLRSIIRKEFTEKLIGNWKMADSESNWVIREDNIVAKMITINSKEWTLIKSENLTFMNKMETYFPFTEIVYSNKEIWNYHINEDTGLLTIRYTGEETKTGRTELIACGYTGTNYFRLQ
jgi:hypothetical protein